MEKYLKIIDDVSTQKECDTLMGHFDSSNNVKFVNKKYCTIL